MATTPSQTQPSYVGNVQKTYSQPTLPTLTPAASRQTPTPAAKSNDQSKPISNVRKAYGKTAKATGTSLQVAGTTMRAAGTAANAAGTGMAAVGTAAMAVPFVGTAVGGALRVVGMGTKRAGKATSYAGKKVNQSGKQLRRAGNQALNLTKARGGVVSRLGAKASLRVTMYFLGGFFSTLHFIFHFLFIMTLVTGLPGLIGNIASWKIWLAEKWHWLRGNEEKEQFYNFLGTALENVDGDEFTLYFYFMSIIIAWTYLIIVLIIAFTFKYLFNAIEPLNTPGKHAHLGFAFALYTVPLVGILPWGILYTWFLIRHPK